MFYTYRISGEFDFVTSDSSPSEAIRRFRSMLRSNGFEETNFELSAERVDHPPEPAVKEAAPEHTKRRRTVMKKKKTVKRGRNKK